MISEGKKNILTNKMEKLFDGVQYLSGAERYESEKPKNEVPKP